MPRGRGRSGRYRASFAQAVRRVERPIHRREFEGRVVDPGPHPKQHALSPWVDIVVELGAKGDKTFSPNLIANEAREQHGYRVKVADAFHNVPIDIRFKGYYVWSLASSRPISLTVHDLHRSDTANDVLKVLNDWPAYNQYARVGYWLPLAMTRITFDDSNTTKKVISVDTTATQNWLAHVYCSIRCVDVISVTSRYHYDDIVSSFDDLHI